MRSLLTAFTIAAIVASGPLGATSAPEPVVGGWSAANVDPQVRAAARFALTRLKRGKAGIRSIDAVERQVVAGTNYRIRMTLTDKTRWDVTVWQRLDRSYRLTSARRITGAAAAQGQLLITGSVIYRERMALPPGAVVTVSLEDISRADASATLLARQTIRTRGEQVPIRFALTIDRNRLPGTPRNSVSARIEDGQGRLMWITDTIHSVEHDGRGNSVDMGELMLVRTGG